jgi:hypothetical protein
LGSEAHSASWWQSFLSEQLQTNGSWNQVKVSMDGTKLRIIIRNLESSWTLCIAMLWKEGLGFFGTHKSVHKIAYNTQFRELLYAELNFMLASLSARSDLITVKWSNFDPRDPKIGVF